MPNHIHGIVVIAQEKSIDRNLDKSGGAVRSPIRERRQSKSLSTFVGGFKAAVTKRIKERCDQDHPRIWQRNYHESIIRDEGHLGNIRQYIINNRQTWEQDPEKSPERSPSSKCLSHT